MALAENETDRTTAQSLNEGPSVVAEPAGRFNGHAGEDTYFKRATASIARLASSSFCEAASEQPDLRLPSPGSGLSANLDLAATSFWAKPDPTCGSLMGESSAHGSP
jgi:hypothetical protein